MINLTGYLDLIDLNGACGNPKLQRSGKGVCFYLGILITKRTSGFCLEG